MCILVLFQWPAGLTPRVRVRPPGSGSAPNPGGGGACLGEASAGERCGNGNRAGRREEQSFVGRIMREVEVKG